MQCPEKPALKLTDNLGRNIRMLCPHREIRWTLAMPMNVHLKKDNRSKMK